MVKFRVVVLNLGWLCYPGDYLAMSAGIFDHQDWGRRVLLASSEVRPGMLLNILQRTEQPSMHKKIIIKPKMLIVVRLRNTKLESNFLQ